MRVWLPVLLLLALLAGAAAAAGADGRYRVGVLYRESGRLERWNRHVERALQTLANYASSAVALEKATVPQDSTRAEQKAAIAALARSGVDVVLLTSSMLAPAFAETVAEATFDTRFVCMFGHAGDIGANRVVTLDAAFHEALYYNGALLSAMSSGPFCFISSTCDAPIFPLLADAFYFGLHAHAPQPRLEVLCVDPNVDPGAEILGAELLRQRGCVALGVYSNVDWITRYFAADGRYATGLFFPMEFEYDGENYVRENPNVLRSIVLNWGKIFMDTFGRILNDTESNFVVAGGFSSSMLQLSRLSSFCPSDVETEARAIALRIMYGLVNPWVGPLYDTDGSLVVEDGVQLTQEQISRVSFFLQGITVLPTNITRCPAGSHLDGETCVLCDVGTHTSTANSFVVCEECPAGTEAAVPGQTNCTPCQPGFFKPSAGSELCQRCDVGTYSDEGATICEQCPPGTIASKRGSTGCHACALGTFQEQSGQTACNSCPEFHTTPHTGSKYSNDCRCHTGYIEIMNSDGSRRCQKGIANVDDLLIGVVSVAVVFVVNYLVCAVLINDKIKKNI